MPTTGVWSPFLDSLMTSAHQPYIVNSTPARPAKNSHLVPSGRPNRPFIHITAPTNMMQAEKEAISGQGLGSTRW